MKKKLILYILISGILCFFLNSQSKKNYNNAFFGVYGKRASVMGKVDGSAFEIWIYPYKLLHHYKINVFIDGLPEDPYTRIHAADFSPDVFKRSFTGESWSMEESVFPALKKGVVFLNYRIRTLKDMTLELSFKPDLQPMWPASLGGKYCYLSDRGYFVFSESSGKNSGVFGGIKTQKMGKLPAHKLPGGIVRTRVKLKKGTHLIRLAAVAGKNKLSRTERIFSDSLKNYQNDLKERKKYFSEFFNKHLNIITPDQKTNRSLRRAVLNVESAFVDNPELGEGLIAGYGLSGESERPGFCWYFGGDGIINAFSVLDYGNFAGGKKELEFLFKYQRKDGKIMHELSQGEGFVDWFNDYSFAFFHGDTTLYFVTFLDFYLKRTGDVSIVRKYRKQIEKIFNWMQRCDADKDGIVETSLAGTGASETGPLRQQMKTDILLASLSVKAWESMVNINKISGNKKHLLSASRLFKKAKKSLTRLFWNQKDKYYCYAVKKDNSKINEVTVWPSIGMRFKVFPPNRGILFAGKIASPYLSADWGTRFLSTKSKYYHPLSYNNGAVWPFLTGFSSLALYNYHNPYFAYTLLSANINLIGDFDPGALTELLSGDMYRPLDQSVPNQIWSSGNTIAAFVEGLVGFETDVPVKRINLSPAIPLNWETLSVSNLKAGRGTINFNYIFKQGKLTYKLEFLDLKDYFFNFRPSVLCRNKIHKVAGKAVDTIPEIKVKSDSYKLTVEIELSGYLYPYIKRKISPGDYSAAPIIESLKIDRQSFVLEVWGKGKSTIFLITDQKLVPSEGVIDELKGRIRLNLDFSANWQKKRIVFKKGL